MVISSDSLSSGHVTAWLGLWATVRVDVTGNVTVARAVYGSLYYILSSMVTTSIESDASEFVGLSPTGLPYGSLEKVGHRFSVPLVCRMAHWRR